VKRQFLADFLKGIDSSNETSFNPKAYFLDEASFN